MYPLAVVEEKLCTFDRWPSSVLTDMFYKESKVSVSRRVDAFLYVNGVSVRDAAKLYKASQAAWRNVLETQCAVGICSGIRLFLVHYSTTMRRRSG